VRELYTAFDNARTEYGYTAPYHCVFPIKVNQQRHLVDVLFQEGAKHGMGIEVGSKPELLSVMSFYAERNRLIICNDYKDREYVELALLTSRLGTLPILVVEKSGLQTILTPRLRSASVRRSACAPSSRGAAPDAGTPATAQVRPDHTADRRGGRGAAPERMLDAGSSAHLGS
jgi:hypothetical protein